MEITANAHMPPQSGKPKLTRVLSTFVCVLLSAFVLSGVLWLNVLSLISENGVREMVSRIDMYETSTDLIDTLTREMPQNGQENFAVDGEALRSLLDEEEVKAFISGQFSAYIEAVLAGDDGYTLPREELVSFLMESRDLVESYTGYRLSDTDLSALDEYLAENGTQYEAGRLFGDVPLGTARFFLSTPVFVSILLLCLACLVCLFFLQKRRRSKVLLFAGASLEAAGLVAILVGLLPGFLLGGGMAYQNTVRGVISFAGNGMLISGLWVLGAGVLTTASYVAVSMVKKQPAPDGL